jgi:acetyl-CoA acetyltransferase
LTDIYILSAVRTPIGKFGGGLASQTAADMGVVAAKAALERAGVEPAKPEADRTLRGRSPCGAACPKKFPLTPRTRHALRA